MFVRPLGARDCACPRSNNVLTHWFPPPLFNVKNKEKKRLRRWKGLTARCTMPFNGEFHCFGDWTEIRSSLLWTFCSTGIHYPLDAFSSFNWNTPFCTWRVEKADQRAGMTNTSVSLSTMFDNEQCTHPLTHVLSQGNGQLSWSTLLIWKPLYVATKRRCIRRRKNESRIHRGQS